MNLTHEQQSEMQRLKSYFPFRIVYGAVNPQTSEWRCAAVTTMRQPNRLARDGWNVAVLKG